MAELTSRRTFLVAFAALALVAGALGAGGEEGTPDETLLLQDGFEESEPNESRWPSAEGVTVDGDCGAAEGETAAHLGGEASRRLLASRPFDADADTFLRFAYTTGWTEDDHAEACPAIHGDQGVLVQYSTDGGHTWNRLAELTPSRNGFTSVNLFLPADEGSEHTQIRWIQPRHDGTDADNWAIDEVTVTTVTDDADPVLGENETDLGGMAPGAYAFRREVTITNEGEALEDHPIEVILDTASWIDAGKLQSDCDDLRFTATTKASRLLDHEVTSGCGSANTTVWVEVPSIPNGTSTIELHYGDVYGGFDAPVQAVNTSQTADPQPTTSLGGEEAFTDESDGDGDGVPDELEVTLCSPGQARSLIEGGSNVGLCDSETDYRPRTMFSYTMRVPQWTNAGVDADGDGFPGRVAIEWMVVTVATEDGASPFVRNGGVTWHTIDPTDDNSSRPSIAAVCKATAELTVLAYSGGDDDEDGVPDEAQTGGLDLCVQAGDSSPIDTVFSRVRYWDIDPADLDASVPNTTLPSSVGIPYRAFFSADADGDGLPARGGVDELTVTWDTVRTETSVSRAPDASRWDPDDQDEDEPRHAPLDVDGDAVPDTNERHACEEEHKRTRLDGYCTDLGTDYHPPRGYPSSFDG